VSGRIIRTAGGVLPPFARTLLALLLAVGVALVAWVLAINDAWPLDGDGYEVTAVFDDAGGLRASDESTVTVAGVEAGRVVGIRHEGGRALVRLRLDASTAGKVHEGARITVRPRSQLGDLLVELTPGPRGGRPLRDGDRIATGRTAATVPLSRVVATLDADTRSHLQLLIGELDRGAGGDAGGRRLAAALRSTEPLVASADAVLTTLDRRRELLRRLVGHLDRLFTAIGRRGAELRDAIAAARATLDVTARRADALRATVRALPGTLADTRRAVDGFHALGRELDPALEQLRPTARELPATLRAVRAALPSIDGTLGDLRRTVATSGPAAAAARTTADLLASTAPALRGSVAHVGPSVAAIDRNRDGIGLLGERFSGIFSTADANGTILRGLGFFETFDPANFGFGNVTGAARQRAAGEVVAASAKACRENAFACLVPFLVPGLRDTAVGLGTTARHGSPTAGRDARDVATGRRRPADLARQAARALGGGGR